MMIRPRHISKLLILLSVTVTMLLAPCLHAEAQDIMLSSIPDGNADVEEELTKDQIADIGERIYKTAKPLGIRYTKRHPLIIAADWSFKPYTFVNDQGEPDGFQIEIFRSIFERLRVPYEIHMMDWRKARKDVESGKAHLMMAIAGNSQSGNLRFSRKVVGEYQLAVMHLKTTNHIRSILLLNNQDSIFCKKLDYGDQYIREYFGDSIPFHMDCMDPMQAQKELLEGKIKYYIWGRSALRTIVRRYDFEQYVDVDPIDIPAGQFRFASTDEALLYEMDIQLQRLIDMGKYEQIVNHWLVDNPVEEQKSNIVEIIAVVTLVVFIVIFLFAVVMMQRSGNISSLKDEFRAISKMAIGLNHCQVIAISTRQLWVHNISGNFIPDKGISFRDFEELIHPEDINAEYGARSMVDSGMDDLPVIQFRMKKYGDSTDDWRNMSVHAYVKKNRRGKPVFIYLVLVDETERLREQQELDHSLREFSAITEISDIGMIYFDVKGRFVNCNRSVIKLFGKGGASNADNYVMKMNIQDMPVIFNGIKVDADSDLWFCAPLDVDVLNLHATIEVRIHSVFDDQHQQRGYAMALIDLEESIKVKREIFSLDKRLDKLKLDLMRYQIELRYILRRNKMNTFRWSVGNDFIEVSRDLVSFDYMVSLKAYYDAIVADDKQPYEILLTAPEKYFAEPQQFTLKYKKDINNPKQTHWYTVCIMPEYDDSNRFIGAFGVRCDITEFMESKEQLQRETERAEDSGRQKALFLANMTHELRTPLNAINGFAEILKVFSTPEEKKEYIGIMSHNCSMLISLVDNILQLSMMDTDGIRIHREDVDFAVAFPEEARKLKHYVQNPDVSFIIDTPMKSLNVSVDMARVMQIVDAVVNNASKFTKKGYIRVGYRYLNGLLTIYCRDTGCGVPQDKQAVIFNRFVKLDDFVQGTGLGLSVCKMIAEQMGATIDLYSREGEGTTVSLSIRLKNKEAL